MTTTTSTTKKVQDGPYTFELLFMPRSEWLTNLDFVCLKLNIDESQFDTRSIERVRFNLQGYMQIRKNYFGRTASGHLGNHFVVKKWIFFDKSNTQTAQRQEYLCAFRINSQMPIRSCPSMQPDHKLLPPSHHGIEIDEPPESPKTGYAIIYQVLVQVNTVGGEERTLCIPFEFNPTDQQDKLEDDPMPAPQRVQLCKSLVLKDLIKDYGELKTLVSFPDTLYLTRCAMILSHEILLELTWSGEARLRPELHSIVPYLLTTGAFDMMHASPGDHVPPLLKLDQLKGREHTAHHWTAESWQECGEKRFSKKIQCLVTLLAKEAICPSFTSCLATRQHTLRLVLDVKCPGARLFKHQTIQMQFPVVVAHAAPATQVDPDESFMQAWWEQTDMPHDLEGLSVVEYFKQPDRKPSYFGTGESSAQPAPMANAPPYVDGALQEEMQRTPAWHNKGAATAT